MYRIKPMAIRWIVGVITFLTVLSLAISSFPKTSFALSAPVMTTPSSGVIVKADLTIGWTTVSGAQYYLVAVRNLTTGESIVYDENVGTRTSYILPGGRLTEGHSYRIAVGAVSGSEQKWNQNTVISVTQPVPSITPPVVYSPSGGGMYPKTDLQISWSNVQGVQYYLVAVRNITTGESIVYDENVGTRTSYTLPGWRLTEGQSYRIAVGAVAGNEQRWNQDTVISITQPAPSITPPVIHNPSSGGTYPKTDLQVSWSNVQGAQYYLVAVRNLTTGESIVYDENVGSRTSYTLPGWRLTEGQSFRIAVGAVAGNEQRWNQDTVINITQPAPSITPPVIYNPSSGGRYPKADLQINWYGVQGAQYYLVAVRNLTTGESLVYDENVGNRTGYTLPGWRLAEGNNYRIAVAAVSGSEQKWNQDTTFSVTQSLVAPTVTSPVSGSAQRKADLQITWSSVAGAQYYLVAVRNTTTGEALVIDENVGTRTSYTLPGARLAEGSNYRVAVAAVSGSEQKWNQDTTFSVTHNLVAPTVTSPVSGSAQRKADLQITWSSVPGAQYYLVAVRDTTTGEALVIDENVGSRASFTLFGSKLTPGHSYRVAVATVAGNDQRWNQGTMFSVTGAVTAPTALRPASGGKYPRTDLQVTWNVVSGAEHYLFALRDLTTNTPLVVDENVGTRTAYTIPKDLLVGGHSYRIAVAAVAGTQQAWNEGTTLYIELDGDAGRGTPPVLSGFPSGTTTSVTIGQKHTFRGRLTSSKKITRVTLQVVGTTQTFTAEPNATSFDLSSFTYDASASGVDRAGTYEVRLWAKTEAFTDPVSPLGVMYLEVKPGRAPELVDLPNMAEVPNGSQYQVQGRVKSTVPLTKVTATLKRTINGVERVIKQISKEPPPRTLEFALNAFEFTPQDDTLYRIEIRAENEANRDSNQPLGTMVLRSVPVMPPQINVEEPLARVRLGEAYVLKGQITSASRLTKVTALVPEAGIGVSRVPATDSYSLGNLTIDTRSLKGPGLYRIQVWAKSEAYPDPKAPLATVVLEVSDSSQASGSQFTRGYLIKGLKESQATILAGMAHQLTGVLVSQTPLTLVNFIVKKDGQSLDNTTFRRDARGSVFDFRELTFKAVGKFATPGKYTLELWASSQGQDPRKLDEVILTVQSPLTHGEARYLEGQDRLYLAAWAHPHLRRSDGSYPPVLAAIWQGGQRVKVIPLSQVTEDGFETYISGADLPRGSQLVVDFMAEGYDALERQPAAGVPTTVAVTIPQASWRIKPGSQRYQIDAETGSVLVEAGTDRTLPLGFTAEVGVAVQGKGGWRYYPLASKGATTYAKLFRLQDLGMNRGVSYVFRVRLVGHGGAEIDRTGDTVKTVPQPTPPEPPIQLDATVAALIQGERGRVALLRDTWKMGDTVLHTQALLNDLEKGGSLTDPVYQRKVELLRRISFAHTMIITRFHGDAQELAAYAGQNSEEQVKYLVSLLVGWLKIPDARTSSKVMGSKQIRNLLASMADDFEKATRTAEVGDVLLEGVENVLDKAAQGVVDLSPLNGLIENQVMTEYLKVFANELKVLDNKVAQYSDPKVPMGRDMTSTYDVLGKLWQKEVQVHGDNVQGFINQEFLSGWMDSASDWYGYVGMVSSIVPGDPDYLWEGLEKGTKIIQGWSLLRQYERIGDAWEETKNNLRFVARTAFGEL
ncbi:MAG TPA: fibronectin type III domain-containing protein [Symbiobacteriaceae bacterium]|nr:fibronectin type III domain-containing protein [Symbiobacteriaceae bacterium]